MANKFLYFKEEDLEGTLYAEDGGVAIIWHNGEHLVGQCYRERIDPNTFYKKGIGEAFQEMIEDSSNSAMFDFEDSEVILPFHLQELAEWLCAFGNGDFFENLTIFDYSDYDKSVVHEEAEKAAKAFFDNEHFKERIGE